MVKPHTINAGIIINGNSDNDQRSNISPAHSLEASKSTGDWNPGVRALLCLGRAQVLVVVRVPGVVWIIVPSSSPPVTG